MAAQPVGVLGVIISTNKNKLITQGHTDSTSSNVGSKTWNFPLSDPIVGFWGQTRQGIGIDKIGVVTRYTDCPILKNFSKDKSQGVSVYNPVAERITKIVIVVIIVIAIIILAIVGYILFKNAKIKKKAQVKVLLESTPADVEET